jgi:hypothetical protein
VDLTHQARYDWVTQFYYIKISSTYSVLMLHIVHLVKDVGQLPELPLLRHLPYVDVELGFPIGAIHKDLELLCFLL